MWKNTCAEFHGVDPSEEQPRSPAANAVLVVGATATGKTEFSLDLATMIYNAYGTKSEVIAADKRTAHFGTEVTAAAPNLEEQARVPHHMVGVLDPFDYLVPRWTHQAMARACMRDIASRGRLPITVGGSIHLMEALAYYPGFHSLASDKAEQKRLKNLSLDDLREESLSRGFGGPFQDDPRRWRNHIMARAALQRPWDQPPWAGTLLLGVRRDPQVHKERIVTRLENSYPQMVEELEQLLLKGPMMVPPRFWQTIGVGDFWVSNDTPKESRAEIIRRTKQSILDHTNAFAEWQELEIRTWMEPHIHWVESAEEASELYDSHIQTLP